jgi:hypothetical protein
MSQITGITALGPLKNNTPVVSNLWCKVRDD